MDAWQGVFFLSAKVDLLGKLSNTGKKIGRIAPAYSQKGRYGVDQHQRYPYLHHI